MIIMTETEVIEAVAMKNQVTPDEVRSEIQFIIDDLWLNYQNDTEEFKRLRLMIGHKPSIMEFLEYCVQQVR